MQQRAGRRDRERKILFGLVEYYLRTGKPVGSQVLQEEVFSDISSATIRNYFVSLEKAGYIKQQHLSGGRVPLGKAFSEYAKHCFDELEHERTQPYQPLSLQGSITSTEVISLLQCAADGLSQQSGAAVAVSSPRFDHDMMTEVKFVFLDIHRTLAVITTEFGFVHTSILYSNTPLSHSFLRKVDRFTRSRLFREELEVRLFEEGELEHVRKLYQEAMASYCVSYSSISDEDLWRVGFSRLLSRPEFEETQSISASLSLFENSKVLRGFSHDAVRSNHIRYWIGDELASYIIGEPNCAVVASPYRVSTHPVGAFILIGSMRVFYRDLFWLVQNAVEQVSELLTNCLIHHRMTYRMPETHALLVTGAQKEALEFYKNPVVITPSTTKKS